MKAWHRHLVELAVVCASTAAGSACVIVAARTSTNIGDVLGFFGGMLGATFAVVGALYVERSKRISASQDRLLQIEQALQLFVVSADQMGKQETRNTLAAAIRSVQQAWAGVVAAVSIVGPAGDTAPLIALSQNVLYWNAIYDARLSELVQATEDDQFTMETIRARAAQFADTITTFAGNLLGLDLDWPGNSRETIESLTGREI